MPLYSAEWRGLSPPCPPCSAAPVTANIFLFVGHAVTILILLAFIIRIYVTVYSFTRYLCAVIIINFPFIINLTSLLYPAHPICNKLLYI